MDDAPTPTPGPASFPRHDLLASIVVFLIALPLCIGIAIASGVPVAAGLVSGVIGGIIIGYLSGSPLQVSGPAAGLSVIVYDIVQRWGVDFLGLAVAVSGIMQIIAGMAHLGQWFRAVSPAVIRGMLAGIGFLILGSQFHVMLDLEAPGSGAVNLATIPDALWQSWTEWHPAGLLGLATIGVIILWSEWAPKKLAMIPAALVAAVVISLASVTLRLPVEYVNLSGNIWADLRILHYDQLQSVDWFLVFEQAALLAVVSSAATLLCSSAVDQMHTGPRTKYDQELIAQGVGNSLAGFLGALPISSVIIRSSANVQAGAQTRLSTILHGFWLLIFVTSMTAVLRMIPVSCLAAILVYTGYKLIDIKSIRELRGFGWGEVAIYALTISVIVMEDLLTGVVVGIVLSAIKLIYTFSRLETELDPPQEDSRMSLRLRGAATFLRLPLLARTLEQVPAGTELKVDLTELEYIDHACLELLTDWRTQHRTTGGELIIDWESLHARFRREKPALTHAQNSAASA